MHGRILVPDGSAFVGRPPAARLRMTPGGLHMEMVDRARVDDLPEFVTPIGDPNRDR